MAERNAKGKESIEEWLLSFEALAAEPIVITLLVADRKISFIRATSQKWMEADDEGEENSDIKLQSSERITPVRSVLDFTNYIR